MPGSMMHLTKYTLIGHKIEFIYLLVAVFSGVLYDVIQWIDINH